MCASEGAGWLARRCRISASFTIRGTADRNERHTPAWLTAPFPWIAQHGGSLWGLLRKALLRSCLPCSALAGNPPPTNLQLSALYAATTCCRTKTVSCKRRPPLRCKAWRASLPNGLDGGIPHETHMRGGWAHSLKRARRNFQLLPVCDLSPRRFSVSQSQCAGPLRDQSGLPFCSSHCRVATSLLVVLSIYASLQGNADTRQVVPARELQSVGPPTTAIPGAAADSTLFLAALKVVTVQWCSRLGSDRVTACMCIHMCDSVDKLPGCTAAPTVKCNVSAARYRGTVLKTGAANVKGTARACRQSCEYAPALDVPALKLHPIWPCWLLGIIRIVCLAHFVNWLLQGDW